MSHRIREAILLHNTEAPKPEWEQQQFPIHPRYGGKTFAPSITYQVLAGIIGAPKALQQATLVPLLLPNVTARSRPKMT